MAEVVSDNIAYFPTFILMLPEFNLPMDPLIINYNIFKLVDDRNTAVEDESFLVTPNRKTTRFIPSNTRRYSFPIDSIISICGV